jgi:hypothetical protein
VSDYTTFAKCLHWLALRSSVLNEFAFDLEKALFLSSAPEPATDEHVFIQGLARAGTTILMREIYDTGEFTSLTYRDMPFVLCCNAWAAATRMSRRDISAKERAHGDGIAVDMDSPEALDEVFWRVFAGPDYIRKDRLQMHVPIEEVLDQFADYIRLILRRGAGTRYVSKNNNNIMRLPDLLRRFPNSVFLVPVRSPSQHASSLLRMHRRFSDANTYTQRYMTWLGHHEFGATHRPFHFSRNQALAEQSPQAIDYWLTQWLNCYEYLDRILAEDVRNACFVPYELLCEKPEVWPRIMQRIGLSPNRTTTFRHVGRHIDEHPDPELLSRADALYETIVRKSLDRL